MNQIPSKFVSFKMVKKVYSAVQSCCFIHDIHMTFAVFNIVLHAGKFRADRYRFNKLSSFNKITLDFSFFLIAILKDNSFFKK